MPRRRSRSRNPSLRSLCPQSPAGASVGVGRLDDAGATRIVCSVSSRAGPHWERQSKVGIPRGRPVPSTTTIHFVPLLRWFCRRRRPFFGGAKLPSKKASLHFTCWRSFNSARNARQRVSQPLAPPSPATVASRSTARETSGANPASEPPLRRTHKVPSSTLRSSARGRPPRGRRGRFGSKGRIFSTGRRSVADVSRHPPSPWRFSPSEGKYLLLLQN